MRPVRPGGVCLPGPRIAAACLPRAGRSRGDPAAGAQGLQGVRYDPAGIDEALARTAAAAGPVRERLGVPNLEEHLDELGRWLKARL